MFLHNSVLNIPHVLLNGEIYTNNDWDIRYFPISVPMRLSRRRRHEEIEDGDSDWMISGSGNFREECKRLVDLKRYRSRNTNFAEQNGASRYGILRGMRATKTAEMRENIKIHAVSLILQLRQFYRYIFVRGKIIVALQDMVLDRWLKWRCRGDGASNIVASIIWKRQRGKLEVQ